MKVRFISFASNEFKYIQSLNRIKNQASLLLNDIFSEIIVYTEDDLKTLQNEWWLKNQKFIQNNKRGFGYWIWKPFLILKNLQQLDDDDILIYCDSGCELNHLGLSRLKDYIDITKENGNLKFNLENKHLEKIWCKQDLLNYIKIKFNLSDQKMLEIINTPQIMATVQFYKKSVLNMKMLNDYCDICQIYNLIDDSPSLLKNDKTFIEHRHDQAVHSLLSKIYNNYTIEDETWPLNMANNKKLYPIHALRNYSFESKLFSN